MIFNFKRIIDHYPDAKECNDEYLLPKIYISYTSISCAKIIIQDCNKFRFFDPTHKHNLLVPKDKEIYQ